MRLSGGASQETWSFRTISAAGASRWVLRRRPPGAPADAESLACSLDTEARLIALAAQASMPVPQVAYELQPADGLGSGFVSAFVDGETIPRKILRDESFAGARARLTVQCAQALARLHALDVRAMTSLRRAPARVELDAYRARYRRLGTPKPVLALAFEWLDAHLPPAPDELVIVHGDFRMGNLMVGRDGLRAVLDWELSHLGDPMEDLGWICVNSWRFGIPERPVGGFGSRDEFYAAYEAAGGRRVNRAVTHFWEVLGTLKWCLMCQAMSRPFASGGQRSIERAAIGRRASEAELDLLVLLAPRRDTSN